MGEELSQVRTQDPHQFETLQVSSQEEKDAAQSQKVGGRWRTARDIAEDNVEVVGDIHMCGNGDASEDDVGRTDGSMEHYMDTYSRPQRDWR